jgi:ring-1,2-phenylacetyl-CoA epoxidase subunit PaaA
MALTAKVQDEVGHAMLLYRIAETLGRSREEMFADLVEGRARFHNVFHYPAETWADVAIIQVFVDGAAMQTQGALRSCSYAPYARVLKRICYEEDFHIQLGLDVWRALAEGTPRQRAMLQDALNRWWTPIIHFFGMPDRVSPHSEKMLAWRIKIKSNEELRQQFLRRFVPVILEYGLEVPDPGLRWVEADQRYVYAEPDWEELKRVGRNNGPKSAERLALRQTFYRQHAWVRDAIAHWAAA